VEQSEEGPGPRRAAGRHVARRGRAGRPGAGRHGRRRSRTGKLAAGALALAGGVAVLLGVNGTFGGALSASGTSGEPGTGGVADQEAGARKSRAPANPGQVPKGDKGASEVLELQKGEARPSSAPSVTPEAPASATPGTAEPGVVEGKTEGEEAGLPDPGEGSDYKANGPSRHTDRQAAEYFRTHWGPDDKAMKRLKDIRTVGGYLRIYTDLPDSAGNSRTAMTLCKRGLEYLRANGVAHPIVFVQAEFGENGNPVLANILGPSDTNCRITYPEPH
jgi:hypothetical protein